MDDDLSKILIMVAVLGALLVGGLALQPAKTTALETPAVTETKTETKTVVLPQVSLEMLDPAYSEKGVYEDDTIRISFKASQTEKGVESRLPFWFHNMSKDVVAVLWDRCSMQLPAGNTVNITTDDQLNGAYYVPSSTPLSIAPCGDLFGTLIPVSEVCWFDGTCTDDGDCPSYTTSTGVLDKGPFLVVFAVEKSGECGTREIKHYTFRLVIR